MRILIGLLLALLLGLLAARFPSINAPEASFSWLGFATGVTFVVLALFLAKPLTPKNVPSIESINPLLRWLLRSAMLSLVLALVASTLLLYTPWHWPQQLIMLVVPIGALSVFFAAGIVWFGGKNGGV